MLIGSSRHSLSIGDHLQDSNNKKQKGKQQRQQSRVTQRQPRDSDDSADDDDDDEEFGHGVSSDEEVRFKPSHKHQVREPVLSLMLAGTNIVLVLAAACMVKAHHVIGL